jgi:hypothetical protein
MKDFSTRCMDKTTNGRQAQSKAASSTLACIRQFARVYRGDPTAKKAFCGFVLN